MATAPYRNARQVVIDGVLGVLIAFGFLALLALVVLLFAL